MYTVQGRPLGGLEVDVQRGAGEAGQEVSYSLAAGAVMVVRCCRVLGGAEGFPGTVVRKERGGS